LYWTGFARGQDIILYCSLLRKVVNVSLVIVMGQILVLFLSKYLNNNCVSVFVAGDEQGGQSFHFSCDL